MRIRPRNYSTACAPSGDSAKLCRLAHVQCVTFFTHAERLAPARRGRGSAHESHTRQRAARHTPHAAYHAPARGLPKPQRNNRTLPNNVARNSPRSFFDYVSKRCNSNAANSKFEIVARELRAKLMKDPAAPHDARRQAGPAAPHDARRQAGPAAPHDARRQAGPAAPHGAPRHPAAPGGKQALRHQDRVPESEGTVNPGG